MFSVKSSCPQFSTDSTYKELKQNLWYTISVKNKRVPILPIRNWNSSSLNCIFCFFIVPILPIRNWNFVLIAFCSLRSAVPILLIRNWNTLGTCRKSAINQRTDSTYKELKPWKNCRKWNIPLRTDSTYKELKQQKMTLRKTAFTQVPILPIRNWNTEERIDELEETIAYRFYL